MLKVSNVVKEQYKVNCPISFVKCEGDENLLEYKIRRAVNLGENRYIDQDGSKIIRYHYLNFKINDEIINEMFKDKTRPEVHVDEEVKELHKKLFFDLKLSFNKIMSWINGKLN